MDRLAPEFKDLDVARCRVVLIEGGDRLLASMSTKSSAAAERTLKSYGVEIRLDTRVVDVSAGDHQYFAWPSSERRRCR